MSDVLTNFKRDVEDAEKWANQESGTVTNRAGKSITPLPVRDAQFSAALDELKEQGDLAVQSTGWFVVGTFAAGFTYTAANQVGTDANGNQWSYNGSLPFTVTAGTVPSSPDYTNRGDAALRSELAAEGGASLVRGSTFTVNSIKDLADAPKHDGRQYSVAGFYAGSDIGGGMFVWDSSRDKADHNITDVIDPNRVSAWNGTQTDYTTLSTPGVGSGCYVRIHKGDLRPEFFGVFIDGSPNSPEVIQAMLGSGKKVQGGKCVIKLNSAVNLASESVNFEGDGDDTVFDFSDGGAITFESPLLSLPALAENIPAGTQVVTFSANHGLSIGDVFILENQTDFSWSSHRAEYHDGDMMKVFDVVSPTVVKIVGTAPDPYLATDMTCFKLGGGKFTLNNCRVIPASSGLRSLTVIAKKMCRTNGLNIDAGNYNIGIMFSRCYDIKVNDLSASAMSSDAYPLSIANCKKVRVNTDGMHSIRHCIGLGGNPQPGAVPTRDVQIHNCTFENDHTLNIGAADIHGNCDCISYVDCIIDSGVNPGGRNMKFKNCVIRSRELDGNCSAGSPVGGYFKFEDCDFEIAQPVGTTFGLISVTMSEMSGGLNFSIKNCTVNSKNNENIATLVRFVGGDLSKIDTMVNIEIDGVTISSGNVTHVFDYSGDNISSKCRLAFTNLAGFDGALYFRSATPIAFRQEVPMRTDIHIYERVVNIIAANNVANVNTGAIPFNIKFSARMPVLKTWMMDATTGNFANTIEYYKMRSFVRGHSTVQVNDVRVARTDNAVLETDRTIRVFVEAGFRDF